MKLRQLIWMLLVTGLGPMATQAQYSFTNVVDSTQGYFPSAAQINDARTVVFGAQKFDSSNQLQDIGYYKKALGEGVVNIGSVTTGLQTVGGQGGGPSINSSGLIAVTGTMGNDASTQQGIFVGTGGPLTKIADNSTGSPFLNFNNDVTSINDSNVVAFHADLRTSELRERDGIFIGSGGAVTTVADSTGLFNYFTSDAPTINAAGTVAFWANTTAGPSGIYTVSAGGVTTMIADDTGPFAILSHETAINADGTVAFYAALDDNSEGIFTGNGGPITTVADTSGPYQTFTSDVAINGHGVIAFRALLDNGGDGIFIGPNPALDKVIAIGDPLFGSTVVQLEFNRGLNENGDIAFSYMLDEKVNGINVQGLAIASPTRLLNISTRLQVGTDPNALIGGFILTGSGTKQVIIRAIGPSLPVSGKLADTTLELHDSTGTTIAMNDNWKDSQQTVIEATTIAPSNDLESALVATLPANNSAYTAIVRGKGATTGIGLVEVYDLDQNAQTRLANISTRGFVDTGDNVLIGGFIVGALEGGSAKVIVRGLGPSLPVDGKLVNPTLELHDASGTIIESNDNWKSDQEAEITATTIPPTNDLESAIVQLLGPGNYTAILRGKDNATGVGLLEVYALN